MYDIYSLYVTSIKYINWSCGKSGNVEEYCNNKEYMNIICDILDNDDFVSLEKCKHHGINRLEHSMRVSYYSYYIAKKLKLNFRETARGGLLHDFFHVEELAPKKQKFCFAVHPYQSLNNATILSTMHTSQLSIYFGILCGNVGNIWLIIISCSNADKLK